MGVIRSERCSKRSSSDFIFKSPHQHWHIVSCATIKTVFIYKSKRSVCPQQFATLFSLTKFLQTSFSNLSIRLNSSKFPIPTKYLQSFFRPFLRSNISILERNLFWQTSLANLSLHHPHSRSSSCRSNVRERRFENRENYDAFAKLYRSRLAHNRRVCELTFVVVSGYILLRPPRIPRFDQLPYSFFLLGEFKRQKMGYARFA